MIQEQLLELMKNSKTYFSKREILVEFGGSFFYPCPIVLVTSSMGIGFAQISENGPDRNRSDRVSLLKKAGK